MESTIRLLMAGLATFFTLTGCISNPINAYTGNRYYDYGVAAEKTGDWKLARENYYRAYVNAQWGNLGPATQAYCIYEWSRMTGYLGMYAEAEKGFDQTLSLIDKAKGRADGLRAPALCELARLLHDTDQHAKAILVYEQALVVLEKAMVTNDDPIAFADFLDDYADSLRATAADARADEFSRQAAGIRLMNSGKTAKFIAQRYK